MAVTEDRRTYTIYEIQDILRIGRSTAYRLVHTGEFRSVRVGGQIRIVKSSFDEWLGDHNSHLETASQKETVGQSDNEKTLVVKARMPDFSSTESKVAILKEFMKDPNMVMLMKMLLSSMD